MTSIFDKSLEQGACLSGPMRLAISNDAPRQWPAWNMDFDQEQAAPRAYVGGPAKIRVVENGPVRVAVEVSREAEGSKFVANRPPLGGDAGNRVEFSESIDWRTLGANLKAVFPLSAANSDATYNWEIGTIERPTAQERQFEVASHHWIDLTDAVRRLWRHDPHRCEERVGQARRPHHPADAAAHARAASQMKGALHRSTKSGLGPSRDSLRHRRPRGRLARGRRPTGRLIV